MNKLGLLIFFSVLLALGLSLVGDYGLSWDEEARIAYAQSSLEAYRWWLDRDVSIDYGQMFLRYSGVSLNLFAAAIISMIQKLSPTLEEVNLWHFAYFCHFLLASFSLYGLARRWFNVQTSWAVLLLFISQPLLWGHAFINHTDIPMMGVFTAAIYAGFKLADLRFEENPRWLGQSWRQLMSLPILIKKRLFLLILFWLVAFLLVLLTDSFHSLVERSVQAIYYADPNSLLYQLFAWFAAHRQNIPVEQYIHKAHIWTMRMATGLLTLTITGIIVYALRCTGLLHRPTGKELANLVRIFFRFLLDWRLALAGLLFGLTVSNRVIGLLAGVIVMLAWLYRSPQQAIAASLAYSLWGFLALYLTWPYLWTSPLTRFAESISITAQFPWEGNVLFNGAYYPAGKLPMSYLPTLFHIQLTEPVLLGGYLGLFMLVRQFRQKDWHDFFLYIGCLLYTS
ncbi:MAG: hypothetical protein N2049_00595, partial [Anaerolineales bacterium]|nr:hypothetical protein [Anaerolineales bacterium]